MDCTLLHHRNRNGFGVHMGPSEREGVAGIDYHRNSLPTSPVTTCVS